MYNLHMKLIIHMRTFIICAHISTYVQHTHLHTGFNNTCRHTHTGTHSYICKLKCKHYTTCTYTKHTQRIQLLQAHTYRHTCMYTFNMYIQTFQHNICAAHTLAYRDTEFNYTGTHIGTHSYIYII